MLALVKKADQEGKSSIETGIKPARLHVRNYLNTDRLIDKLTASVYRHHVKRYDLNWVPQDKKDCVKWVNKVLGGDFDPRQKDIIEAEKFFDIELVKSWATYNYTLPDDTILQGILRTRGTIDLIIQVDKNIYEVVDYKSGKKTDWSTGKQKTLQDIQNDIQPRMYHYVLSQLYPNKQIIITMLYINSGGPVTLYYDDQDLIKTEKMLQYYFKTIKEAKPICRKSWKCTRFCGYGKKTFCDTSIAPITHDKTLTQCEQIQYNLLHRSEQQVLEHMTNGNLLQNLEKYNQG